MGTYAGYYGSRRIPVHLRDEFSSRMMKVLNCGGMMGFNSVSMYGKELDLLKPVTIYPGGTVYFYYNYFEDDFWETAEYDAEHCYLYTEKIGGKEFHTVIVAAYTLYEMYDTEPGFVIVNDEIVEPYWITGWLNNILETKFTLQHRIERVWNLAERRALPQAGRLDTPFSEYDLECLVPEKLLKYSVGMDYADLCCIVDGTETLNAGNVTAGTYFADIVECRDKLAEYIRGKDDAEAVVTEIRKLACMDKNARKTVTEQGLSEVAEMTMFLPAKVILYLTAEILELEFWELWKELRDDVYDDEQRKAYPGNEWLERKLKKGFKPIYVSTSDYLREDNDYTFCATPEELNGEPKYFVSDDDRLYWWDGSDEVVMSDEMDKWLRNLAKRHRKIMHDLHACKAKDKEEFMKDFFFVLVEINEYYKRIFPFEEMFHEFIQNGKKTKFRAAVELLRQLSEENREAGSAIKYLSGS